MGLFSKNDDNISGKKPFIEFVKSTVILLLAVVLLVSAVFAWFMDSNIARGTGMSVNLVSSSGGIAIESSVTLKETIYVPAATKWNEVTVSDLSKVLYIREYPLTSPVDEGVTITVTLPAGATGVHFYIDTCCDSNDSAYNYAVRIKNTHSLVDVATKTLDPSELTYNSGSELYSGKVAVVFYVDYTSAFENENAETISYSGINVNFSVISN